MLVCNVFLKSLERGINLYVYFFFIRLLCLVYSRYWFIFVGWMSVWMSGLSFLDRGGVFFELRG